MSMKIGFFEDITCRQFLPLTWTRPVYGLRCGIDCLYEKSLRAYGGAETVFWARSLVADVWREAQGDARVNEPAFQGGLWLNGRLMADNRLEKLIPVVGEDCIYRVGADIAAVRLSSQRFSTLVDASGCLNTEQLPDLPSKTVDVRLAAYPWDLIDAVGDEIVADIAARSIAPVSVLPQGVLQVGEHGVYLGAETRIDPGTVLNTVEGPIWLGAGVQVDALSLLEGPLAVGAGSRIKAGAKIYGGTTLGPVCKVGGEVEGSIIQGYSNKQHDGFLGHAFLGEWINLGANTNNSDLKNNYSPIRIRIDGKVVDTGRQLMGLIMGDHAKSAISTRFNTATVVGAFANVFSTGFPPKTVPNFAWLGEHLKITRLPEALEMAVRMMPRRGVEVTPAYKAMVESLYGISGSSGGAPS